MDKWEKLALKRNKEKPIKKIKSTKTSKLVGAKNVKRKKSSNKQK